MTKTVTLCVRLTVIHTTLFAQELEFATEFYESDPDVSSAVRNFKQLHDAFSGKQPDESSLPPGLTEKKFAKILTEYFEMLNEYVRSLILEAQDGGLVSVSQGRCLQCRCWFAVLHACANNVSQSLCCLHAEQSHGPWHVSN